jgi:cytochrome c-type biogenesis protein CcmH/NrfG
LNPHHAGAQLKIAEIMTSSRQPQTLTKAASQLRELLEVSPQNVEAADALAMTEWRLGNRAEAMDRLQELLAEFPANLSSSVLLARMKLNQNDLKAAEEILQAGAGVFRGGSGIGRDVPCDRADLQGGAGDPPVPPTNQGLRS